MPIHEYNERCRDLWHQTDHEKKGVLNEAQVLLFLKKYKIAIINASTKKSLERKQEMIE